MSSEHLVLIGGKSAGGKSASLENLKNHAGVMYLNCESGKKLPFKNNFKEFIITDPLQILEAFDHAETKPNYHTIVVDTLTYMMDMYESLYVLPMVDKMGGWSNFAQYFKTLMQQKVALSTKKVIFLAHTLETYNESEMAMDIKVPVKGALKNNGIESYFSCVIAAKKMRIKDLEPYSNSLLTYTDEEKMVGFKYVYQTRLTKETVNERLRGPKNLFSQQETFINNDIQLVLDRLDEYYK